MQIPRAFHTEVHSELSVRRCQGGRAVASLVPDTARSRGRTVVRSCPAGLHYLLPLPAQGCGNPRERPAAHSRGGGGSQQPHGELSTGEKVPRLRLCPATSTTTGSGQSHAGNQCRRALPGRRIRGRWGKKEREKLPDLRMSGVLRSPDALYRLGRESAVALRS